MHYIDGKVMDKRHIERATLVTQDGVSYLEPKPGVEYILHDEFHGEYDDDWIVMIEGGKETARFNFKQVVDVVWKEAA